MNSKPKVKYHHKLRSNKKEKRKKNDCGKRVSNFDDIFDENKNQINHRFRVSTHQIDC